MAYRLKLNDDPGWMGDPKRGAGMGRPDTLPDNRAASPVLHLTKMRMTDYGDYDAGGAYWGGWSATAGGMYCAETDEKQPEYARLFVRALNRADAKAQIWKRLPNARIHQSPGELKAECDGAWDEGYNEGFAGLEPRTFRIHEYHFMSGYECGTADRETVR